MSEESDQIMFDVEEDDKAAVFQQIQLRKQLIICSECELGFESVSQLESHVTQVHVGWLPFECRYCLTFKPSESDIRTHLRMRHRDCETKFIYSPDDRRRQRANVIMQQSLNRRNLALPSSNIPSNNIPSTSDPSTNVDGDSSLMFAAPARPSYDCYPNPLKPSNDCDPYATSGSVPAPSILPETSAMPSPSPPPPPRAFCAWQKQPMQQESPRTMPFTPTRSRIALQQPEELTVPIVNLADESDDSGCGILTPKRRAKITPQLRDPATCQLCALVGNSEAAQKFIQTIEKIQHGKSHLSQNAPNRRPSTMEIRQKLQQCFPETDFALQSKSGVSKDAVASGVHQEKENGVHPQSNITALVKQLAPVAEKEARKNRNPSKIEKNAQRDSKAGNTTPSTVHSANELNVLCAECKQDVDIDAFDAHVRSFHMKGPHSKCSRCDFASDEKKMVERHCSSAHLGLSCKATSAPTAKQVEEKIRRCFGTFLNETEGSAPISVEKVGKTNRKNSASAFAIEAGHICKLCKRAILSKGAGKMSHVYEHLLNDKGISVYECLGCSFRSTTAAVMGKHRKTCLGSRMKVDRDSIKNEYKDMYKKCWN